MAGLPSFLLMRYFYRRDNVKPEPAGQVIGLFILGCLMIIPALLIEKGLMLFYPQIPVAWQAAFQAFIVAALIEEGVKFLLVRRRIYRLAAFDEITDGIIYTMAAGLGFAFFENIAYGLQNFGNLWVLLLRGFTAVPLHCLASGLMGYYLGMAWYDRRRNGFFGLILAIAFHGAYDFVLFSPDYPSWMIFPILAIGYLLLFRLFNKAQRLDAESGLS